MASKSLIEHICHSSSVRNFGKLLSANVIAQVIGLLVYPILTRMYLPEDFGLMNLFLSIGGIMVLLFTGEYQSAILLPLRENEASGVARVALRMLGIGIITVSITLPFSKPISHLFGAPALSSYYWLLIPYVAAMGAWNIYSAWLTRQRDFVRVSGYQINQSAVSVVSKLLFGWLNWLRSGLIVSSVISPIVALLTTAFRSRNAFRLLWQESEDNGWKLASKYRRFPLFTMPRSLVNNLSGNLPALLLTPYFGLHEMGFFAMALTLAFRPITMITASLHQVLFERVAKAVRESQSIWSMLRKRWLQMAAAVVPFMVFLTCIMPWLVRVLLGDGWTETATLIRYLMPWLTCIFLVAPFAFVSEVFGKQKLFLVIEIVYLVLRVAAMFAGIWMNSFEWAIILMSAAGTIVLLLQLAFYIVTIRSYESSRLAQTGQ